ncbi:pilus assembly protein [Thermovibrio sp.]
MRRIDVEKKALIGGVYYQDGDFYYLLLNDCSCERDASCPCIRKTYDGKEYIVKSGFLHVKDTGAKYKLKIRIDYKPEGIIQRTWDKVRYGLMIFNKGNRYEDDAYSFKDGGKLIYPISGPGENEELVEYIKGILRSSNEEGKCKCKTNPDPTWTPLAEAYYEAVRYFEAADSAYNAGVSYADNDPIQYRCQKNFVLLLTDGASTKDENLPGASDCWGKSTVSDPNGFDIKKWMDMIADSEGTDSQRCENNDAYSRNYQGTYYLEGVAYYSHFPGSDSEAPTDLRDDFKGIQNLTLFDIFLFGNGSRDSKVGKEILEKAAKYGGFIDLNQNGKPDLPQEWDKNGDGIPDNFFDASDGYKLEESLEKALNLILERASGTSAAILPEKSKRGAVLQQAVFYPTKVISDRQLKWVGYLYAWWFLNTKEAQNIREDTNGDKVLEVLNDRILDWYIDQNTYKLKIDVYSSKLNGEPDEKLLSYSSFDDLRPLWEAGKELAYTSSDDRVIYTTDGEKLIPFTKDREDDFAPYLGSPSNFPACLGGSVDNLVDYVRGKDIKGCRSRTIDDDGDVWKLGDIVYSTPVIEDYQNYEVVFVGANDGMLHAFKLGYVKKQSTTSAPVRLQDSIKDSTTDTLGQELWAFIPKGALPYLRFLASPDYCHLYYVDLRPTVYSVDTNGDGVADRKILIGGMRLGGAVDCSGCSDSCVSPPSDANGAGYSSYFALDVTDPENPKFLWEFSDKGLGFTYSGPALIRKGTNYYVLFANGPTDYKGDSCKNLTFYVLDLLTGELKKKITTSIPNAFGGRLFKKGFDYNGDGNTDYVFTGFSYYDGNTWKGGLAKVDVRDSDLSKWKVSVVENLTDDSTGSTISIGPITSQVLLNTCFNKPYLYFGTGKWFYKTEEPQEQQRLYGLPLNCTSSGCTITKEVVNTSDDSGSEQVCTSLNSGSLVGWFLNLSTDDEDYLAERNITDPTKTDYNVALFTTIEPTSDPCGFGGRSRMWLLNCATGGSVASECKNFKVNSFKGTVLLQLSGSDIHQVYINWTGSVQGSNLGEVFPKNSERATAWYIGIAPEFSPPFVKPGGIIGTLLLWLER